MLHLAVAVDLAFEYSLVPSRDLEKAEHLAARKHAVCPGLGVEGRERALADRVIAVSVRIDRDAPALDDEAAADTPALFEVHALGLQVRPMHVEHRLYRLEHEHV